MRRAIVGALAAGLLACLPAACAEPVDAFARPTAVAFGPAGDVFVADGYDHARVVRFAPDGAFVDAWGERGVGPGQLETPHGIAVDAAGRVLVADRENARVQVFDERGEVLAVWDDAVLGRPWDVDVGPDGRIWVLDGGEQDPDAPRTRVIELDARGEVRGVFDARGSDPPAIEVGHAIAAGRGGAVFVADLEGRRVVKLEPAR